MDGQTDDRSQTLNVRIIKITAVVLKYDYQRPALSRDAGSIPSTRMVGHTISNSRPKGSDTLFCPPPAQKCRTYIHLDKNTNTYKASFN